MILAPAEIAAVAEIARRVDRVLLTVSDTLAKLRAAELVRDNARGGRPRYWLKRRAETLGVLARLKRFVRATARLRGKR